VAKLAVQRFELEPSEAPSDQGMYGSAPTTAVDPVFNAA
jgi:hypothetical protein